MALRTEVLEVEGIHCIRCVQSTAAAMVAGQPVHVAGLTVNRLCASGLQAITTAAHAIAAGAGDLFVAGGVESMTRAPFVMGKPDAAFPRGSREMHDTTLGWRFVN